MGEFSPVQLDALEDALEDLELAGVPSELQADDAVGGRLAEYRDLLTLSREAMPSVEVPVGILDGVLAAAREDAAKPSVAASQTGAEQAEPWWRRISLWIPVLAVGASAALVLVMVRGMSDAEPEATVAAKAEQDERDQDASYRKGEPLLERADELQAVAEPAADAEDEGLALGGLETRGRLRGGAAVQEEPAALPKDAAAPAEEAQAAANADGELDRALKEEEEEAKPSPDALEPTDKVLYDAKGGDAPSPAASKPVGPGGGSKSKSGGAAPVPTKPRPEPKPAPKPKKKAEPKPPPEPAPAPEPDAGGKNAPGGLPKTDDAKRQEDADPLTGAEGNRKQGRCGSARSVYNSFVDDAEASTRAKALAGLGLCALAEGDDKAAEAYFTRAKKADAGISSFIRRERAKVEAKQQTQQKK